MKSIFLPLTCLLSSFCLLNAQEARTWFLEDGTTFKATYKNLKKESVVLEAEGGRSADFPISKLSIPDRYYLNTQHEIPLETLDKGNYDEAERKMKMRSSVFKDLPKFRLKGEGYDLELNVVESDRFHIIYERGVKYKDLMEAAERTWYSMAYRIPGFVDWYGDKKRTFVLVKKEKTYEELGAACLVQLKGKIAERQWNQIKMDWVAVKGVYGMSIPPEYAEKNNTNVNADIVWMDVDREHREHLQFGFAKNQWALWYYPGQGVAHEGDHLNNSQFYWRCALNFNKMIQCFESDLSGYGAGADKADGLPIGGYGKPEKWGKDLAKAVAGGSQAASFNIFAEFPKNDSTVTTPEVYRNFGMTVVAAGRFLQHDLKNMLSYCKFCETLNTTKKYPDGSELAEIYGYESSEELDAAFEEFIVNKNQKME